MKTIVKIQPSGCVSWGNALHAQFHNQMYTMVNAENLDTLHITQAVMQEWNENIQLEIDINREVQASAETAQMAELETQRDAHVTYLFGCIRNEALSPIAPRREAGQRLKVIIDKYKGLQDEAVDEETLHITGLLTDLAKEGNAADVTTLGLDEVLVLLKTANDQYQALRSQRTESRATTRLPASKEVRPQTDAVYDRVCRFIEASYLLAENDELRVPIANLVARMNQFISEMKATWKQSQSLKKAAADKKAGVKTDPGETPEN